MSKPQQLEFDFEPKKSTKQFSQPEDFGYDTFEEAGVGGHCFEQLCTKNPRTCEQMLLCLCEDHEGKYQPYDWS
mgnify:CR=1 FL=1|jgi:hypothetical protein|tara:strand:+ start:185 stop:406 length:222 start_codon:yes stop_codon:yes gene_type:complete